MFQEFACNGTVVEHPEYGEVLQLQGDQRHNICGFLTKTKLAKADQLKVHGFQTESQNIRYGNCIDIEWITVLFKHYYQVNSMIFILISGSAQEKTRA